MRLPGENEERGKGLFIKYTVMGVSLSILLVLGVVLFLNSDRKAQKNADTKDTSVMALDYDEASEETQENGTESGDAAQAETAGDSQTAYDDNGKEKDIEKLYQEHKLTAADLDIWDMYPEENPELVIVGEEEDSEEESGEENKTTKNKYEEAAKAEEEAEKEDPSKDGKHTLLTYADGTEEWVLLSPYLEKNTYDYTKLTMKADKMGYYEDGKKISYLGVDLSKYNGSVDFAQLKSAGVDFAMVRLGARGYGSGQVILDEKFTENMTNAAAAGMTTGVYFFSQAITKEEAVEEANFVIQNLSAWHITYPIAFDMEYVENDTSRIEALSRDEKTAVAKAFLDTVKAAGYKPMLYGNKEWLIKQVDLTKLTGYDVWLSQQEDVPDYPYQFQMWQYTLNGKVSGIEGDADLNISFVDYTEK